MNRVGVNMTSVSFVRNFQCLRVQPRIVSESSALQRLRNPPRHTCIVLHALKDDMREALDDMNIRNDQIRELIGVMHPYRCCPVELPCGFASLLRSPECGKPSVVFRFRHSLSRLVAVWCTPRKTCLPEKAELHRDVRN